MQKLFIPKRDDRQSAPLSLGQQRLWFLDQLEPNTPRYNCSRALRLRGTLNIPALQKSLDAIVRRHEILRSNFFETAGIPVQAIGQRVKVTVIFVDLSDRVTAEAERRLLEFISEQVQRPYNLTADSMLRAGLVRMAAQDHVLLLILPHITTDGW